MPAPSIMIPDRISCGKRRVLRSERESGVVDGVGGMRAEVLVLDAELGEEAFKASFISNSTVIRTNSDFRRSWTAATETNVPGGCGARERGRQPVE